MARIACAFIARFELAIRARQTPALWTQPLAITEVARTKAVLHSVTPAAEALHLSEGMPLNEALVLVPDLTLIAPDPPLVRAAEAEVLASLGTLSPALDSDGLGAFYLTLAGLDRLYEDEAAFAEQTRRCLKALGFEAGIGIADGPLAARIAAGRTAAVTLVPPGEDVGAISGVSIGSFGLPAAAVSWLEMLGLREAGQLATLPPGTLSMRLPIEGPRIERLCRGETPIAWPSASRLQRKKEEVKLDLDGPTSELEPLLFIFKSLIDQLLGRVASLHHALTTLHVEVKLDDRSLRQHTLTAAHPTLDGRQWLDLARLWLSAAPFATDVAGFRLVAERTEVAEARQLSLFHRREDQARNALLLAVKRLAAVYGETSVVQPVLVDTYLPEARLRWTPFAEERLEMASEKLSEGMVLPVLRFCSPPEPVLWDGRRVQRANGGTVQVLRIEGPCRFTGWAYDRSYFWLLGESERLWIFQDELGSGTYLQAVAE